ncbi:MAG: hypothetical protein ACSHYA_12475 [Opitutaceae bacterium]
MPKTYPEKYSEEEWASICGRFSNSILNETEIAKLGQNAGISWPFKGSDETPNKYIEYTLDELNSVPGLIGKKSRIHKLVDILRETLAFDDPFGDMADKVEAESEIDETFDTILGRIDVPLDYPARFVHFSEETIELLALGKPETLIDIVHFGQTLDQSSVQGADLRAFMNSLAHKDDRGIRKHIPYRRGEQGLHLAEAIGLIAEDLDEALQVELLFQSGAILTDQELDLREREQGNHSESQLKDALDKVTDVCEWFVVEAADLKNTFSSGGRPERFFLINDAPRTERVALALARLHFGIRKSSSAKADGGIIGKLASIFGR